MTPNRFSAFASWRRKIRSCRGRDSCCRSRTRTTNERIGGRGASASASAPPPAKLTGTLMRSSPLGPLKRGSRRGLPNRRHTGVHELAARVRARNRAIRRLLPAVTVNGGRTWRINGPVFHIPALQAPFAVTQVGALNARTYYAWGAQSIDATSDGGKHWWRTLVPNSAWRWSQADRRLIARTRRLAAHRRPCLST